MVQNVRGKTSWSEMSRSPGPKEGGRNFPVQKVRGGGGSPGPKSEEATRPGPKYQGATRPCPKREGRNVLDQKCYGAKWPGAKAWERNVNVQKVRGRNVLGAKRLGPKTAGAKLLVQIVRGRNVQFRNVGAKRPGPKGQVVKRPGPKCGRNVLFIKSGGETSWSKTSEFEKSGCENTSWASTSWLWNFLYDNDTLWGFFMIVRFFYFYRLNLIYDSIIGLTQFGEIWYCWSKTFIRKWYFNNYKLPSPWPWPSGHRLGGDGRPTEKTLEAYLSSDHIWIRSIQGFGNNEVLY